MSNPVPTNFKKEIAPLAIILACFAASFYFNAHWPDLVASHWNFKGEVDAYSSKTFNAFFFPGLLAAMYLLFTVLPYFDPKRERYAEFSGVYLIFRTMIIAVMAVVYFTMGIFNLGYDINVGAIVAGLLVGFGTRLGSGCTSGHGVCGLSRLSPRSLAATLAFMGAGFATVFVARHLFA